MKLIYKILLAVLLVFCLLIAFQGVNQAMAVNGTEFGNALGVTAGNIFGK